MKKRILILGASGLIGHQVYFYLKQFDEFQIINSSFTRKVSKDTILFDLRNSKKLDNFILKINPDYIVNCVGLLIEDSKNRPLDAIYLNAYLPHLLKSYAEKVNAKLIHISTDCVFSGNKGAYSELDEKDGTSIYARTKSLGEIIDNRHLTLRTSVVGPELKLNGTELFNWFMSQFKPINGYTKSIWSGVSTIELAKAVKRAISQNTVGLYQITNNDKISKFELLSLINKHRKIKIEITPIDGVISDKSLIDTRNEFDYTIPSFEKMVNEMFEFIKINKKAYKHYKYI